MSANLRGATTRPSTSSASLFVSQRCRRAVCSSSRSIGKSRGEATPCTQQQRDECASPAPSHAVHQAPHPRLNRRSLLTTLTACTLAATLPAHADEVKLLEVRDNDVGYSISIPEGWTKESPGGKYNFYPPHDYAGKRVMIEASALGKKLDLDLAPVLGSPEQYGQSAVLGMETELLSTSQAEGGRYYYYEYTLPSFKPNRVWGIAGVGLGPNPTARQYNRKQLVKVTCMVPEEDLERDGELMRKIVASFHFME